MEKHLEIYNGGKLEIKSIKDAWAIIRGYGVVFGGKDKVGDTFLSQTEYELKKLVGTSVYVEHALTGFDNPIGEIVDYGIDEIGLWVEAKIDNTIKIAQEYLDKIRKGLVGWSSGTAAHLVRRIKNVITKWPIVEMSLTTNPAEPRTMRYGIQQIKSTQLVTKLENEQESVIEPKDNEQGLYANDTITINTKVKVLQNGEKFS